MKRLFAAGFRLSLASVIMSAVVFMMIRALNHPVSRSAVVVEDCSCTAPDESCSANISCKAGCSYFCGNEGNCWAECSDNSTVDFSLEMRNATYPRLVAELSRIGRKKLEFTPAEPKAILNISFKSAALWDALEYLSDRGTLRVEGKDFQSLRELRKVLLIGGRTSFSVSNTPVDSLVNDLSFVTGLPLRIVSGKRDARVSLTLRNVTLNEILKKVSEQTGVRIRESGS